MNKHKEINGVKASSSNKYNDLLEKSFDSIREVFESKTREMEMERAFLLSEQAKINDERLIAIERENVTLRQDKRYEPVALQFLYILPLYIESKRFVSCCAVRTYGIYHRNYANVQ